MKFKIGDVVKEITPKWFEPGSELLVLENGSCFPFVTLLKGGLKDKAMNLLSHVNHGRIPLPTDCLEYVNPPKVEKPFPKLMMSEVTNALWMVYDETKATLLIAGDSKVLTAGNVITPNLDNMVDAEVDIWTTTKPDPAPYPKLVQDTGDNAVLWMVSDREGYIVHPGESGFPVGYHSTHFRPCSGHVFEDFEGVIQARPLAQEQDDE